MKVILDTNALIRFFTDDIPEKADLVELLLKKQKRLFVPDVVFPELEYVFSSRYSFRREKIIEIYSFLSSKNNIHITKQARIAIVMYEQTAFDMADCIIAAYSLKGYLASFDKKLLQIEGVKGYF